MKREVSIRNAHRRLRVPLASVREAIAYLDANFEMLPGDLPYLALPPARLAVLKSKILPSTQGDMPPNRKSKIPSVCPPGELSLVFLTDAGLAKLHADFMDDPTTTDVITFEGDSLAGVAGEICVSADTAAKYVGLVEGPSPELALRAVKRPSVREHAKNPGKAMNGPRPAGKPALQKKFAWELTLYVIHGWLHLSGYDDLQPARKRRMRAAEKRAMALLAAADAIPEFRLL